MIDELVIKTTQFKRGLKATLEHRLVASDLGVLLAGEPAFETDTGQMKIGNGVSSYAELPYVGKGHGGDDDPRFVIHDPKANQVLIYDSTTEKWINKDLSDKESIIYLAARGLTLKGYETAKQGQIPVKDNEAGIAWINPVSDAQIQAAVAASEHQATRAASEAQKAETARGGAETAQQVAEIINQTTLDYLNNKFWWGTLEEYNSLEKIDAETFYFLRAED